jgi:hypothetical protein
VSLSTLYRPKEHGGWGLINPAAKCLVLFIARMQELGTRKGTVTADWMRRWGLQEHRRNPPHNKRTPNGLEYLNRYYIETAYLPPITNVENSKAYKRRLHTLYSPVCRPCLVTSKCVSKRNGLTLIGRQYGQTCSTRVDKNGLV